MAPEKPLDLSAAKVVPPWYKQQWLLWFSMVIFPPLGIGLTWFTDWSPKRKKITSGAGVAWFALMLASGGQEAEITANKEKSAPEQQVSSRSATPREAISFGMLFPEEMKSESGTSRLT